MKIENLSAVPISTVEGLPERFSEFSDPRDRQLEKLTQALQRKLSFPDNFNAQIKTLVVRHLVPLEVSFELSGKLQFVFLGIPEIEDFVRVKARLLSSNIARLTFSFDSAPTTPQPVTVLAIGT